MRKKKPHNDDTSNPGTEAFVPDFEDTGTQGFVPNFDDTGPVTAEQAVAPPQRDAEPVDTETEPDATPVQPVAVPGRYQYLKWWKLVLVILGVWLAAAEVGLSLFYWWYHTIDKTAAVFMVLVYVVVCAVAAVLLAMVEGRPLMSALSIAVMSGPFASLAAAAPLYGYYYCARTGSCLVGVIPY